MTGTATAVLAMTTIVTAPRAEDNEKSGLKVRPTVGDPSQRQFSNPATGATTGISDWRAPVGIYG